MLPARACRNRTARRKNHRTSTKLPAHRPTAANCPTPPYPKTRAGWRVLQSSSAAGASQPDQVPHINGFVIACQTHVSHFSFFYQARSVRSSTLPGEGAERRLLPNPVSFRLAHADPACELSWPAAWRAVSVPAASAALQKRDRTSHVDRRRVLQRSRWSSAGRRRRPRCRALRRRPTLRRAAWCRGVPPESQASSRRRTGASLDAPPLSYLQSTWDVRATWHRARSAGVTRV